MTQAVKLNQFVAALLSAVKTLEDAALETLLGRFLDNAVGAQLDGLGDLVGEDRLGRGDDDYRNAIRVRIFQNAASGTPADCVKLGIKSIMKKRPDLVVSGINLGGNLGYNVLYSGTVSGATEGALLGIPSLAISLDTFKKPDFTAAAAFSVKLAGMMKRTKLPPGTLLNVNLPNVPAGKLKGVRVTNQSRTSFNDWFDKRQDPHGNTYYWMTGDFKPKDADQASDLNALRAGYVSVTPIQFDLTNYKFITELENWEIKL